MQVNSSRARLGGTYFKLLASENTWLLLQRNVPVAQEGMPGGDVNAAQGTVRLLQTPSSLPP